MTTKNPVQNKKNQGEEPESGMMDTDRLTAAA